MWAGGKNATRGKLFNEAIRANAVRCPDPVMRIRNGWIVRRLSPDCSRIEIETLPRVRDEERLLRAMGWETANLHLGHGRTLIRRDLKKRERRWLETAALAMADAVETDWHDWVKRGG